MGLLRRESFWLSLATGSCFAAAVLLAGRRVRRRSRAAPSAPEPHPQDAVWRFDRRPRMIPAGSTLRIEVTSPALVHWTADQWDSVEDTGTRPFAPGLHVARLPTAAYTPGARIQFTLYWPEANRWEGEDFEALIVAGAGGEAVRSAQSD